MEEKKDWVDFKLVKSEVTKQISWATTANSHPKLGSTLLISSLHESSKNLQYL